MKRSPKIHAKYLIWSARALSRGNRQRFVMDRGDLHFHLFRWGVEEGLIPDPAPLPEHPWSYYVACLFAKEPELVKAEARTYWHELKAETANA